MTSEGTCASCIWWERRGPRLANASRDPSAADDTGTCQFRPPVVVQGTAPFPVTLYPVTHESRFCGEWAGLDEGGPNGGETVRLGRVVVPFGRARAA